MPVINNKDFRVLLILVLAAAAFRVTILLLFPDQVSFGPDQIQNTMLARKFAGGDYFGFLDSYWPPLYPFLLGLTSLFSKSLTLPSVILSIIVGVLVAPVTYLFVKQSYERKEATVAAAISVFSPQLLNKSVVSIGNEGVYLLLITGAAYFGWRALGSKLILDRILTGALLGLAYLTRPEAIGYFGIIALVLLFQAVRVKMHDRGRALLGLGTFCFVFMACAAPYMIYLRNDTGRWQISGKVSRNLWILEMTEDSPHEHTPSQSLGQLGLGKIKNLLSNIIDLTKRLPSLMTIELLILAGIGLFGASWDKLRFRRELYLLTFCGLTTLFYVLAHFEIRYFYVLYPVLFGWIAVGLFRIQDWAIATAVNLKSDWVASFARTNLAVTLALAFILVLGLPYYRFAQTRINEAIERDAGIWLKENAVPDPRIFSGSLAPIFFAEGESVSVDSKNLQEIAQYLKTSDVEYVVTSSTNLKFNPHLKGLDELLDKSVDFEILHKFSNEAEDTVIVYHKIK